MRHLLLATAVALSTVACSGGGRADGDGNPYATLLKRYEDQVLPAYNRWKHASWRAHTQVVDGDARRAQEAETAKRDWLRKATDARWAREARDLIAEGGSGGLVPTEAQQEAIDAIRTLAKRHPATEPALLSRLDTLTGTHARLRLRTRPAYDGVPVELDALAIDYANAYVLDERLALWEAITAPAARLRGSFLALRETRNEIARKGGWTDHLTRELDAYGMTLEELEVLLADTERSLRPLYEALHTWARYEMATRVGVEPPAMLPAHWFQAPLGNDWSGFVALQGESLGESLRSQGAPAMLRNVDALYTSFGLDPLPATFWEGSSLYPSDPQSGLGKTGGSSAWDINLAGDVRLLMSATPSSHDWHQANQEFGFAHSALVRWEGKVPLALRQSPPRALAGSLGAWADLIASRPDHLEAQGLVDGARRDMPALLAEALAVVPWVHFMSSVAVPWEKALYADELPDTRLNEDFWTRMREHMGINAPGPRGERYADALLLGSFHDLPGRTVDPLLATLIAYHAHVTVTSAADADPVTADLSGNPRVGEVMRALALADGRGHWRRAIEEATGRPFAPDAVATYFSPLLSWLEQQNATRSATLPRAQ